MAQVKEITRKPDAGNSRPQELGHEVIENVCAFLCAIL
jgi:hypothetical protein